MEVAMHTQEIKEQNLIGIVKTSGIVLIDWWASWCGPCRAFAPVYESVAAKHPDIVFGKVDTEAEPALASAFRIRSIPTLMVFRDGVLLFAEAGMLPASALEELIAKVKELDMSAIGKDAETREEAPPLTAARGG
jgi:thioredoxin 1